MAKAKANQKDGRADWARVYKDVKETRDQNGTLPDPKPYERLTKSAGSKESKKD